MTPGEFALLRSSNEAGGRLEVTVQRCWWSCCGRGWQQRDYEAAYVGRVAALADEELLLLSDGLGGISFAMRVALGDVALVEPAA